MGIFDEQTTFRCSNCNYYTYGLDAVQDDAHRNSCPRADRNVFMRRLGSYRSARQALDNELRTCGLPSTTIAECLREVIEQCHFQEGTGGRSFAGYLRYNIEEASQRIESYRTVCEAVIRALQTVGDNIGALIVVEEYYDQLPNDAPPSGLQPDSELTAHEGLQSGQDQQATSLANDHNSNLNSSDDQTTEPPGSGLPAPPDMPPTTNNQIATSPNSTSDFAAAVKAQLPAPSATRPYVPRAGSQAWEWQQENLLDKLQAKYATNRELRDWNAVRAAYNQQASQNGWPTRSLVAIKNRYYNHV